MSSQSPSAITTPTPTPTPRIRTILAGAGGDPAVPTVAVAGDVDLSTADSVGLALEAVLTRGHRDVRVDLSSVAFLDCAGLGIFVRMHQRFAAAGGGLILTGVSQPIARLLRMTELHDLLTPVPATSPGHRVPSTAIGSRL